MRELHTTSDIFSLPSNGDAVCVTTNGDCKQNGDAVMGKGIALQANNLFAIAGRLGQYLRQYGNRVFNMGYYTKPDGSKVWLLTFPTKHHWKELSDITLICKSCEEVMDIADKFHIGNIYLPPPGCGNGGLNYAVTVQPWILNMLDDRFTVVFRN